MRYRIILSSAVLALWSGAAQAGVALLEAGIICPRISTGELVEAPGTEAGFIRRIEQGMGFDLMDRTVPLMDNLSFGFRVGLKAGAEAMDVTVVVTHPPMGARGVTREEWTDTLWPGMTNLNLFTFEEDYEKVPGDWTFAIEADGETLVNVPFTVADTPATAPVDSACFQFMS
ncbi:MAG: DUF3859 domain-containing protein [Pseudomonadota bacterium]